jgi:hypothetical protein
MPWGKYRGKPLAEIPESYLRWVLEEASASGPTLREAIRFELDLPSESDLDTQRLADSVRGVVRDVYRQMAIRFHPDRGGSTQAMSAINHMHDRLQEALSDTLPKPTKNGG